MDTPWIVIEVDGKVASIATDYRHLPRIAAQVAALPPEEVEKFVRDGEGKFIPQRVLRLAGCLPEDALTEYLKSLEQRR